MKKAVFLTVVLLLVLAAAKRDAKPLISYDGYSIDLMDVMITINPYTLAQNVAQYANMLVFAHEGERLGLKVSEEEIDNFLLTRWDNDELLALQEMVGREKVRKFAKLNLLSQKAIEHYREEVIKQKKIKVTDEEVKRFYVEHLKEFTVPKRYQIDILALDKNAKNFKKTKKKVDDSVSKSSLEKIAKILKDEDGVTFIKGNVYTEEGLSSNLPAEVAKKIKTSPVNKIVGPEEANNFVMYFQTTKILPEEQKKLDEVKEGIKEKLLNDKIRDDLNKKLKEVFDREKGKVNFEVEFFRKLILGENKS